MEVSYLVGTRPQVGGRHEEGLVVEVRDAAEHSLGVVEAGALHSVQMAEFQGCQGTKLSSGMVR